MNEFPGELQQLFRGYGEFHADLEASPEFMPALWAKIEAKRSPWYGMQRMVHYVVGGALAAALLMGAVLIPLLESSNPAGFYADVVAQHDRSDDQEYAAALPIEVSRR